MYGQWIGTHPSVRTSWSFGYADASVHRIISDFSTFSGHENPQTHRILADDDLNILHGYGDGGRPPYREARYRDRSLFVVLRVKCVVDSYGANTKSIAEYRAVPHVLAWERGHRTD